MNKIAISIIIATFNAEKTLKQCLESIIPQLTPECELLLIDGGSTDCTNDIISSYKSYISYFISEKDNGIYDAWNKGVKAARGNWVAFIGADDILLPNALRSYLDMIHNTKDINTYDYICALNEHIDEQGKILKVIGGAPKWSIYRKRMNAAHVASLHNKKNLFDSIGLYDFEHYHICADYELLIRKKDKLKYIFLPVHIARMKIGGMSFSTKAILETFKLRKQHNTVPTLINYLLFIRDWAAFRLFVFRKKLTGGKF